MKKKQIKKLPRKETNKEGKITVSFQLEKKLIEELEKYSKKRRTSKVSVLRESLRVFLSGPVKESSPEKDVDQDIIDVLHLMDRRLDLDHQFSLKIARAINFIHLGIILLASSQIIIIFLLNLK